eukprot:78732-Prorocentrum_minimum.AAC.1
MQRINSCSRPLKSLNFRYYHYPPATLLHIKHHSAASYDTEIRGLISADITPAATIYAPKKPFRRAEREENFISKS